MLRILKDLEQEFAHIRIFASEVRCLFSARRKKLLIELHVVNKFSISMSSSQYCLLVNEFSTSVEWQSVFFVA